MSSNHFKKMTTSDLLDGITTLIIIITTIIIGRRSLERHSLCSLVNLWWCCNVFCGCVYHCVSRGPGEKRGGAFFAVIALLIFLVTFRVSSFAYFFQCPSPAGKITRSIFPVVWINFACFEASLNRRVGHPTFQTHVAN